MCSIRLLVESGTISKPRWYDAAVRYPPHNYSGRSRTLPIITFPDDHLRKYAGASFLYILLVHVLGCKGWFLVESSMRNCQTSGLPPSTRKAKKPSRRCVMSKYPFTFFRTKPLTFLYRFIARQKAELQGGLSEEEAITKVCNHYTLHTSNGY